ncbi:unnamed protein product [Rotaria sordida]|uniref:Uncharacterized protein n=1 Tax=Rotaria sordida TaxID=392033 RepID=A0A814BAK8_9BILA|nr:unnamed protein product [Rotaria sordida]CAF1008100.1 unnamed protein product [Rotaria sordida]
MSIESTLLTKKSFKNIQNQHKFENIIESSNDDEKLLSKKEIEFLSFNPPNVNIPLTSQKSRFNKEIQSQASNREQHLSPLSPVIVQEQQLSVVPRYVRDEQQSLSSKVPIEHLIINTNKIDTLSSVIRFEQPLSPSFSQLIPDPIINDKQTPNRIFNEKNSIHFTYPSQLNTITPIDSSLKTNSDSIHDDLSSSNNIHYYQISTIFTSISTFIMHQNEVIGQTPISDRFLSDTIFIILITTLTIIILFFCLGLFCLCRRTNKRNISPSFDGASYIGLNEHSLDIPMDNYQQQISKYENDISYINDIPSSLMQTKSSINHPSLINNDRISLHNTIKHKSKINEKKLKKKRLGNCCCCYNSKKQSLSTKINERNRMRRNEI